MKKVSKKLRKKLTELQGLNQAAEEAEYLSERRKLPKGYHMLSLSDGDAGINDFAVDLTPVEYSVIRRYLLRNRLFWLREKGVEV